MKKTSFDLVIFDCDGVLVESEELACRIYVDMFHEYGYALNYEESLRKFFGMTLETRLKISEQELGWIPPADFIPTFLSAVGYEVERIRGEDVRRDLARAAVSRGLGLLELRPLRMSLEEVFPPGDDRGGGWPGGAGGGGHGMSNILAIAQKEIRSYFASPIAYVVIGLFALLFGYFYVAILDWFVRQGMMGGMGMQAAPLNLNQQFVRPLLLNATVVLLFVLPMITMRTYAEEKRSGTIELLLTSPVTDLHIILGKFFWAMALYAAMLCVVDSALHGVLRDERAPLVLAGVEFLLPLFRAVSGYPNIASAGVRGNPDGLDLEDLRRKAWPLVEPELTKTRRDALAQFRELHSTATGRASTNLPEIVAAAHYGRVDALFLAPGSHGWGSFDAATGEVTLEPEPGPHADDLCDVAARETYLHGGTVFPLAPGQLDTQVAATFRF